MERISPSNARGPLDRGLFDLQSVISDKCPLSRWKPSFESFESRRGLKILLDPKL